MGRWHILAASRTACYCYAFILDSAAVLRRLQLRFDFDSTAIGLLIKGYLFI